MKKSGFDMWEQKRPFVFFRSNRFFSNNNNLLVIIILERFIHLDVLDVVDVVDIVE
jgi:hypothetical protein